MSRVDISTIINTKKKKMGVDNYYINKERKENIYLTAHSAHFIYGYMASDISKRTTHIAREETRCRSKGSFMCTIPQTG